MDLSHIYKHYENSLKEIDEVLFNLSKSDTELIQLISHYVINAGGKRLRPLLTIISSDLCNVNNKRHIKLAAAVELIHTATLLHDDVIDESKMRRGVPTANNKWDNKPCVLVGDFLFSQSFILMVKDGSIKVLDVLANASAIISEGEIMQLNSIANIRLSMEDYLTVIRAKTAELFAASCEIAPLTADKINEVQIDLLKEFGLNLGIAFQIIDDAMDYSPSQKMGKNQGDDFYEGKVTLPIMLIRDNCDSTEKERLEQIFDAYELNQESLNFILSLIDKYDVLNECKKVTLEYINNCKNILNEFPESFARKSLEQILEFVIGREF